ncbi:hypothetical protein ODJ79_19880 [Actinoplanes sp. KI2]|uniref:hypothetical protein n=1 Tax=Actinoplanes sp. KI2 TaxID=2983315 RepID=UPI0021D58C14|nr:hypothetical protein [Actinoplanes sp. KI2]MCU7725990.1 hypothetical protein [Actinoplanes sp. KI2]
MRVVDSAPAPLGGITVDRAMREFNTALGMSRLDPHVVRPVRVYQLIDPPLRFPTGDGENFAVVATLVPTAWPQRADTLLRAPERLTADDREYIERVRRGRSLIDTMAELAAGYGAALRLFTEAGFFRHSGSVDNWGIAPESGQVFLTDLDSTQTLTIVGEARRPVEVLRDVASGVFGLAAALMLPGVTDDPAAAIEAFRRLAAGYFAEVPADLIAESIAPLARYWTPLAERSWAGKGALPLGGDRAIWMDRDLCYCLLLHGLSAAYAAGEGAASWGEVDVDRLTEATREFLGSGRFRRFEQFCAT